MTRLLAAIALLALVLLTVTGAIGWMGDSGLRGWTLFAHATIGPVFLIAFALVSVAVLRRMGRSAASSGSQKALFGASLTATLLCAGAILATMTRFAGYSEQISLNGLHAWSGFALAIVGGACLTLWVARPARG